MGESRIAPSSFSTPTDRPTDRLNPAKSQHHLNDDGSLHYAALRGHARVVAYILEQLLPGPGDGPDAAARRAARLVNRRNAAGFTALAYAAWGGDEATARALLAAGADALACNDQVFDPVS